MDEVVAKINHQNERYDALNKKLSEIETSKDDEEVRERLVKENQDKDALINSQQNELNKASSTIARLRDDIEKKDKEIKLSLIHIWYYLTFILELMWLQRLRALRDIQSIPHLRQ